MNVLPKSLPLEYELKPLDDVIILGFSKESTIFGRRASNGAQLVKSVDWGDTWSNLFKFSSRVESVIVLGDDSILVSVLNGDIFRSIDGGTNFSLVFSPSAGSATHWCPMDTYDKFVFFAPYTNNQKKVFMSNDYGKENSWKEILHVKDSRVGHPHNVKFDPYENIIWTVWGDHRPSDTILFSDDFGATWQQPPGKNYYRCTNIMPLPNSIWFGTDEKYWIGAYRYERPVEGTSQTKFLPKRYWAARKDSDDTAPVCWATKPAIIYGREGMAFWGYTQSSLSRLPAQVYATDGDRVYPIWCQDKLADGDSGNGIQGVYGPDTEGNLLVSLWSIYNLDGTTTTKALVKIKLDKVTVDGSTMEYYGKSTDTKPIPDKVGATFFEIDTTTVFVWDGTDWVVI